MGDSSESVVETKNQRKKRLGMTKFERKLFKVANKYRLETQPIREGFYDVWEQQREGEFDPTEHPLYEPMYRAGRGGLEGQFSAARDAIKSQLPKGVEKGAVGPHSREWTVRKSGGILHSALLVAG